MGRRLFFAVFCVLVATGLAFAATGRDRADAIYPPQSIPLEFNHAIHVRPESDGGVGAVCEACHDQATGSLLASDLLVPQAGPPRPDKGFPEHEACESCHDIETAKEGKKVDPPATCQTCHVDYARTHKVAAPSFPSPNLIFNHQFHLKNVKVGKGRAMKCEDCHFGATGYGMEDVDHISTRYQLPKMATCLECHNGVTAPSDCRTCHLTDKSGRLQLAFPAGVLRPAQGDPLGIDHGPRFEFTHGTRAKLDRQVCSQCHTDSYCMTCHDSLQKPLSVHPNDYVTLHPVQAKMDSLSCEGCHRFQSFCVACHDRVGIGRDSDPGLRARNLKVHGDYNTWVEVRGPDHHAIAASRDIKQCISCHREESCMACHATKNVISSSRATDPHAEGFGDRCKALMQANIRACLKCHKQADLMAKPECR